MACYKLDDGQSNPTKCFPPRTFHCRSKEGAGLVAYKKAEEQKCRNVHAGIKKAYKECENSRGAGSRGNTLDGPFLLQLHCVDKPSELCSVNISEQKLSSVKPEDLQMFDNVAYVDASVNSLSLGSFASFVSLRELNLSLNGLCNMRFHAADFPHLQVLDLSYNSLTADDIVSIGRLPRLKVLHLTGNQLHHLPPDLSSSNHEQTEQSAEEGDDMCFGALEVLMLDDNKLSSGVFDSLANLKRSRRGLEICYAKLKYLNLQGNCISEVTFLQPTGSPEPRQTSTEEQPEEVGSAHTRTNPGSQDNLNRSSVPLPELQSLNLADNKIAEEASLTSVQLFPMLRELDVHSNPVATKRRGDLSERLGITIKKTQEVAKPPLKVSADPKWKVKERTPKVSNNKPLIADAPCPVLTQTPGNGREETAEHFFVTQATDVPQCDLGAEARGAVESEADAAPDRLMDAKAKANPDVVEPVGIQTAVRMLEHTLKNLNVYRDSRPTLDSIQMPHGKREKRIKEQSKPVKHPTKRLDEMIKVIKESTSITEVPLSSAIQGTGVNKRERQEALMLLRDMKTKHRMVHKKTMERAAGMERSRNGAEPPP